jgi:hypothetical protein
MEYVKALFFVPLADAEEVITGAPERTVALTVAYPVPKALVADTVNVRAPKIPVWIVPEKTPVVEFID